MYRIGMYANPTTDRLMTMKSVAYAHFSVLGTWVSDRAPCEACGWHWQHYGTPLLVQWEPSTDVIGDFSWDGPFGYTFVVKDEVAQRLRSFGFGCKFLPVEYVAPDVSRPNSVPFPYNGPKLSWGLCESFVDLDMNASAVTVNESCRGCGRIAYTFRYDGIVIRRKDWRGQKMFRITTNGTSTATFVSEEGRMLIEHERFTNIAFSEAGEIVG